MSDSEYSEHELESSFDKNEDDKIDNLDELFKGHFSDFDTQRMFKI